MKLLLLSLLLVLQVVCSHRVSELALISERVSDQANEQVNERVIEGQPAIARIRYINLEKRTDRRDFMEGWLSKQPIPYARSIAVVGQHNGCLNGKTLHNPHRCRGMSGLVKSTLMILNTLLHSNTSTIGHTLVLEDDHEVNLTAAQPWISEVPSDWDIIRFDCKRQVPHFIKYITPYIFKTEIPAGTVCSSTSGNCSFCGGTQAMLWRSSADQKSLMKLRKLWSKQPYDDIDCRLNTAALNSYCVQANVCTSADSLALKSDIPKHSGQ